MQTKLMTLYPFYSLLVGLLLTQILATVQVFLSNAALYHSLLAIKNAGYMTVPGPNAMGRLREIGPAFFGGLFFTFSIGAGISFLAMAMAWIWNRIFDRSKYLVYFYLLLWSGCLIIINIHGFKLFLTLYVFLLPPVVYSIVSKSMSRLKRQNGRPRDFIHITPVFLLALLLASQVDSRMFTDFRDIYLLSSPVGARINSFYYKYTLYPAEALKSLDQKLLKTVMINTNTTRSDLERILLNHDYIPVKNNMAVHLEIVEDDDEFTFKSRGRPILRVSSQAFFTNPVRAIRKFEKKSDIALLLRQMTYISLLTGFPLAIYIIAQGLVSILFGFFISPRTASIIASASCLVVCAILLFSFQSNRGRGVSAQNLMEALSSERWQDRVAALKIIDEKGLEIDRYESYPQLRTSSHIAERYWLVRNLGHSRSPATYTDLLNFLKDPHPNIVTMALYAIGKRGNRQVIDKIMQIIATSDDWYIQWYAYKALRSIGWRQATSS